MNLDRSGLSADEYYTTALQIFDCCGAESTGTLRVDTLVDKFAPLLKTSNAEYGCLKSLLDPAAENPEISVTMLAKTLQKYSEDQKSKVDLDESFNLLKSGPAPLDSDSGISTDGFQLLEELQCELREKSHLAHQLRSQLEFTDRQHEEALAALTAERDSLRTHLNILREENVNLTDTRRDYEEVCERLCVNDRALEETRRELETYRRKNKIMFEQVSSLENEKLTLQELLTKSKAECHRINEMYAARQSALLEHNESLRTEHADLSTRLQDQEEFVQQMIKEKVILEMELKDLLNKSNQTQLRMDRSIDISYTEEQMLSALNTLNADSRFSQDNRILDEESFVNALKEDQGRCTNMSLYEEIRLSFYNKSQLNTSEINSIVADKPFDSFNCDGSFIAVGTQTETDLYDNENEAPSCLTTETQTDFEPYIKKYKVQIDKTSSCVAIGTQTENYPMNASFETKILKIAETQTECIDRLDNNNNDVKCIECEKANTYAAKLERDVDMSHRAISDLEIELNKYENNLNVLEKYVNDGTERNNLLQDIIKSLEAKIEILQDACTEQKLRLDSLTQDEFAVKNTCHDLASVSTQAEIPCLDCEKRNVVGRHRNLRKFFWGPLKCLFQIFAVACFLCAITLLYGVTQRARPACPRDALPWRWLHAQDLLDLLLRIDYVSEVPM